MPMIIIKMKRRICKSLHKVLKRFKKKQVERIEDSQPNLETNAQDLENLFSVLILILHKDCSKDVGTSSLHDHKPSMLRRRFRLSSQHPSVNIISDPNTMANLGFEIWGCKP